MSWEELLDRFYGLRRFGIKPGLERIGEALDREGCRRPRYQTILVGGTNGKGTVASMLGAILQGHGKKVGLFTSPHLLDIRERFRVDGMPLSKEEVEPVLRYLLQKYGGAPGVGLTFFEMTTLAAAMLFERAQVDVGIFEVGMGGRLDSVNAFEPDLSVIATIGRDHVDYLGDEIGAIAREKAGIFRAGKTAVVGRQEEAEATRALRIAGEVLGAAVDFVEDISADGSGDVVANHRKTALLAAERALEEEFVYERALEGLSRWRWPGRFEERESAGFPGRLIIDAAHNPAGVVALRQRLRGGDQRVGGVIWGMMRDKEASEVGELLAELGVPVWGALIDNERARGVEELAQVVPEDLWRGAYEISKGIELARDEVKGDLLIFGSVYLLGELYEALGVAVEDLVVFAGP